MRRRNYLALLGGLSSSLAGCAGETSGENQSTTGTSTTTTTTPTTSAEPASFEVQGVIAPDSAQLGESLNIKVRVKNTGGQTGTWTETLYVMSTWGPEPESWKSLSIEVVVPPGETQVWQTNNTRYEKPAVVYYRLGDEGTVRTIDVPASKAPIIDETNLVSEWNTFGDAIENKISSASVGSTITIAARYWYFAEQKTLDIFRQIEVYNEANERVGIRTKEDQQVTNNGGWSEWESSSTFDTRGWGSGSYRAVVLVRDNQNQEVSNQGTVQFELK